MPPPAGLKVLGLKAATKRLRELGLADDELKAGSHEAGEIVAAEARTLVPVRTGKLRNSIRTNKALNKIEVKAGGAKVPYANPIHWGWFYDRNNFVFKNIRPQPFFYRALHLKREEVYKVYFRNIDRLLQDVSDKQNYRSKVE
jgi:hypothetical protein